MLWPLKYKAPRRVSFFASRSLPANLVDNNSVQLKLSCDTHPMLASTLYSHQTRTSKKSSFTDGAHSNGIRCHPPHWSQSQMNCCCFPPTIIFCENPSKQTSKPPRALLKNRVHRRGTDPWPGSAASENRRLQMHLFWKQNSQPISSCSASVCRNHVSNKGRKINNYNKSNNIAFSVWNIEQHPYRYYLPVPSRENPL